jgi:HrpA-like RNA helicase
MNNTIEKINNKINEINKNIANGVLEPPANQNKINELVEKINENANLKQNIASVGGPVDLIPRDKLFEEIGILDPEGKADNPYTGKPYENVYAQVEGDMKTYAQYSEGWSVLPVYKDRDQLLPLLYDHQVSLIICAPGSGKTVIIIKLLEHIFGYKAKLGLTTPKVSTTTGAANFAAKTIDSRLGEYAGYSVKGDKKYGDNTRLLYMTDGLLLAKILNDPLLMEFNGILLDEIHERGINLDLLMFLLKNTLRQRPDFKLVLMSATVDAKPFLEYYKEFGIKDYYAAGESYFDVEEHFMPENKAIYKLADNGEILTKTYVEDAISLIMNEIILQGKEGDILCFFPGKADLNKGCLLLNQRIKDELKSNQEFATNPFCVELSAKSAKVIVSNNGKTQKNYAVGEANYKKIDDKYNRKVIFATNVAESSITFKQHIQFVVDSGLENENRYYADTGVEALEKRFIARAQHIQRKGRTGRLAPGVCYNLFTKKEYELFHEYPSPPILINDVMPIVLEFMLKVDHVVFPFKYEDTDEEEPSKMTLNQFLNKMITSPIQEYVSEALRTLYLLDAIEINGKVGKISEIGKAMLRFREIDLYMARSIIEAFNLRCANEMMLLGATLNNFENKVKNIFDSFKTKATKNSPEYKNEEAEYKKIIKKNTSPYGDHISILKVMQKIIELNYDVRYERGREKLEAKGTGDGIKWAKDNYISINSKVLSKILKTKKDLDRALGSIIRGVRINQQELFKEIVSEEDEGEDDEDVVVNVEQMGGEPFILFADQAPKMHDKIEDNIIQALVVGNAPHLMQKAYKEMYRTCFPKVTTAAGVEKDSFFKYMSIKPSSCFYSLYVSIGGRKIFSTVSKIPEKVLKNLDAEKRKVLIDCAKQKMDEPGKDRGRGKSKGKKKSYKGRSKSRSKGRR